MADYGAVDPRLGTMADLEDWPPTCTRGGSRCAWTWCSTTPPGARWARRAAAGDLAYRDFYLVYPDRTEPDAYERTLPEVFPDIAPGSFTHVPEMGGWVWTTFNDYQWDLDHSNPAVFRAMLGTMLALANRGVDVLRLDAVPFLWKRMGTDCQNQPEVHLLVQAFRALTRVAAPGCSSRRRRSSHRRCWCSTWARTTATGRVRPRLQQPAHGAALVVAGGPGRPARGAALGRLRPAPARTGWVTYLRCHDDIGWAVSDTDAAAVGIEGFAHRVFLAGYYAGLFPGSFARGALFQETPWGEARTSGMAATLCGIEAALDSGSAEELAAAVRRLETLYSVVFSFGGIPLLWMGDELPGDGTGAAEEAHAGDNRWLHRRGWTGRRPSGGPADARGRVFELVRRLVDARRSLARCGPAARRESTRPATPTCWRTVGGTSAAPRCSRWPTSATAGSRWTWGWSRRPGSARRRTCTRPGGGWMSARVDSTCRPGASAG